MEATTVDQSRLVALEAIVDQGAAALRDMGNALLEIRDARLYRLTHPSFEAYLRERFNFSRQYGYLLMQLAQVADRCQPLVDIPLHSEQHARLIARLPEDRQGPAWARAVEVAGGTVPTTAQVKVAIKEVSRCPIAEELAAEWGITAQEVIRDGKFADAVDALTKTLGRDAKRRILAGTVGLTIDEVIDLAAKPVDDQQEWWLALPKEEFASKDDRLQAQIQSIAIAIDDIADNVGGDAKEVLLDDRNGLTPLGVMPIWCQEPDRQREIIGELRETIAKNTTPDTCTKCGATDWASDEMGRYCNSCKDSPIVHEPAAEAVVDDEPALGRLMLESQKILRKLVAQFPQQHRCALGQRLIAAGEEIISTGTIR